MHSDLAKKLVWMFGSPRTGSTWVMRLLADAPGVGFVDEPYVPLHLVPMSQVVEGKEYLQHNLRADDANYFFAHRYMPELRQELRELILRGFERQLTELGQSPDELRWIVLKEPNGSHAADTAMSLFPESRMIFLLRDGRDVIDSLIDAMMGEDSWWRKKRPSEGEKISGDRIAFIRHNARLWLTRTRSTERAYEMTPDDRRTRVRYEELLADTQPLLEEMLRWLDVKVGPGQARSIVERRAFAAIPDEQKGPGKRARSATPGQWRERLAPVEIEIVESAMGEKLRELGYPAVEASERIGR
jgi:Sulfotransferase family